MFDKPFTLEVITPGRTVLSTQVVSVSAPGIEGGFQVLFEHAPLLSALDTGRVTVRLVDGTQEVFATSGGFLEVRDNKVLLLLETAERPQEIDIQRAEAARDRAKERLAHRTHDMDAVRAEAALHRAMNRLRTVRIS
jgi:F-type H+-transporting ATPase subunit epsilon